MLIRYIGKLQSPDFSKIHTNSARYADSQWQIRMLSLGHM